MRRISSVKNSGLTIVELVVVMVVMTIVVTIFSVSLVESYRESYEMSRRSEQLAIAQQALRVIEQDARYSISFNTGIAAPFVDNNVPGPAGSEWSYLGTPTPSADSRVLILQANATSASPLDATRRPVFMRHPAGLFNCTSQKEYNPKRRYVVIYFVEDGVLYRRILTDNRENHCGSERQMQKQSCPTGVATPTDTLCKAKDERIARDVESFSVKYFSDGDAGGDEPLDRDGVEISIKTHIKGASEGSTLTQRSRKVNKDNE